MHFFNPPRYMPLVELITGPATRLGVLDVERRQFVAFARRQETQARIRHMLDGGKPLRN